MMEEISVRNNNNTNNTISREANYYRGKNSFGEQGFDSLSNRLTAEGGKNILIYLKSFDLLNKPGLLILSPSSHYYYEENDFKSIRTIINLIKLNTIDNLDTFLTTLIRVLPPNINFVGCFSDSKTINANGFLSGLSARFNSLLDSRTDRLMDKKDVSKLLGRYGFKVLDMTEMNGLTYFYSQNIRMNIEVRA